MKKSGFTLVELLVVVAIIGILAAIAIPQFQAYRQRSYDAAAISQGRNAMTSLEAAFTEGTFHCEFTYYPDGGAPVYGGGSRTVSACLPGFTREPLIMTSVYSYGASATTSNNIVTCHRMGSMQAASHNMFLFSSRLGDMKRITSSFNDSIWPNSTASSNLNNGCNVS